MKCVCRWPECGSPVRWRRRYCDKHQHLAHAAAQARYRERNREKCIQASRTWRRSERGRAWIKDHRVTHREYYTQSNRDWYERKKQERQAA